MNFKSVDIFCHRVDNFGDAGFAYRFAKEFKAARPACRVRLLADDMVTMRMFVSDIDPEQNVQEHGGIVFVNSSSLDKTLADTLGVSDVTVETFACHIPEPLMELAYNNSKLIVNIEYLSAEDWVEDYHLKESLLGRGTVRKFYFMPGFRKTTGGLVINSQLYGMISKKGFDRRAVLNGILNKYGVAVDDDDLVGTVFTYERGFDTLLEDAGALGRGVELLVFGDKSRRGMSATLKRTALNPALRIIHMPFIPQHDYDTLLCCTGFNIVRGEDSLARAVLSGRPFIWNAYIQDGNYQLVKAAALLKAMRPYYERLGGEYAEAFDAYGDLTLAFNAAPAESPEQATQERYKLFFKNLKKHSRAARAINYFMHRHCNLVKNFCEFVDGYQP